MRIRRITAHIVRLPFRKAFAHALATRNESDNVLVRCELVDGTTGWGEGVPRPYVTGETPSGCVAQLAKTPVAEQLASSCQSWPEVIALCNRFTPATEQDDPRGCYGNALRCAVELSVLDAYGRIFEEPISKVVKHVPEAAPIFEQREAVQYSAVIDSGSESLWRKALVRRLYGFRDCKVKVGTRGDDDASRLRTIRKWIGPEMDLRVDANEAWHVDELPAKIAALTQFRISCVEQPVPHEEVGALASLRKHLGVPVMLDESLTSVSDAQSAIANKTCDLFNIRLSKCGGFVNSLRIAAMARAAGIGYQLGCHPGESGVLSAAGRHWACSVAGIRYVEGSYDRHVLRDGLTKDDMTFGYGGRAESIARPGLGITIHEAALRAMTLSSQEFAIG